MKCRTLYCHDIALDGSTYPSFHNSLAKPRRQHYYLLKLLSFSCSCTVVSALIPARARARPKFQVPFLVLPGSLSHGAAMRPKFQVPFLVPPREFVAWHSDGCFLHSLCVAARPELTYMSRRPLKNTALPLPSPEKGAPRARGAPNGETRPVFLCSQKEPPQNVDFPRENAHFGSKPARKLNRMARGNHVFAFQRQFWSLSVSPCQ